MRAGLAARRLEAGEAPTRTTSRRRRRAFRYARGLLAGDELDAWLDARGLTTGAWEAYLRRSLALELSPEPEGVERRRSRGGRCRRLVGGHLLGRARRTRERAGDARRGGPRRCSRSARRRVRRLLRRRGDGRRDHARDRVEPLEWVRVRYDVVAFPDEDSAAEAALCVRADGDPLANVAARIGVEVEERLDWMDEVDAELASRFPRGRGGRSRRPRPADGDGFVLAALHAKTPSDGRRRRRARARRGYRERPRGVARGRRAGDLA